MRWTRGKEVTRTRPLDGDQDCIAPGFELARARRMKAFEPEVGRGERGRETDRDEEDEL